MYFYFSCSNTDYIQGVTDETPEEGRASTEVLTETNLEPVPSGDQSVEQSVVEDKITETNINSQSDNSVPPHTEEPHPLDKDQNHDKLLLTRGQDFDLDYTLLGNDFLTTTRAPQPVSPRTGERSGERGIKSKKVPVLKAHERQQLDLKGCEAGETTVPIDPIQDPQNYHKWGDCIQNETLSGWFLNQTYVQFFCSRSPKIQMPEKLIVF